MGVYIGAVKNDYSAMQGPAPSGFHVPLNTEWQAVKNIWTSLGGGSSDGTNFGIALKLPFAGRRSYSSAGVESQGAYGRYWSSSCSSAYSAYSLNFNSTALNPQGSSFRANGFSARCFKNTPTVPTSSWTKLYGTSIEGGGIFWSSTDGLISLSSNGQTWITIQDKNLGATTVWNNGDTLSEANCGKYYQWGNNYGFPRTGSVTTSSTQVDASNYGPGNYYSSSTFIKSSGRWDTTDNGNLRGGITVVKPMSELKNAYIGEYRVPGANTIAYYPLTEDTQLNDLSGNGYNLTNGGTGVFGTYGGVSCVNFPTRNKSLYNTSVPVGTIRTQMARCYMTGTVNSNYGVVYTGNVSNSGSGQLFGINITHDGNGNHPGTSNWKDGISPSSLNISGWTHIAVIGNGTNHTLYVNGQLVSSNNYSAITSSTGIYIGGVISGSYDPYQGYISNVILEDKIRTVQEISDYYNLTKSNYGL